MRRTTIIAAIVNLTLLIGGIILIAPFTGTWVAIGFGALAIYSRPDHSQLLDN